ncbi:hypothetical protein HMPREF1222_02475 [Treponema vincentii F0403]|uniref:Uncharacterized protein n=1 Tax=Treponema vincentii F0403 TaxID=1125702 RepID=S3L813_9SPIR|nr:hypothetical protein [Treponema vincentii]EPF45845.1 hypothetical protein HMPREF1222_02475 [Treponema vincentii F0403]
MIENPITIHQINGAEYCLLASGMEPRVFAHSAAVDYIHDVCFRIAPDGTVQEFYLNETLTFFNTEKGREEVGIVLPLRDARPLIDSVYTEAQKLREAETSLRRLYRLFSGFIAAYKNGTVSEAFFRAAMSAPLCLLIEGGTDGGAQDLIVLPPRLTLRCVTAETAAALRFHYPWVHPDAERVPLDDAASFFLATLSYACITGAPPFNSAAVPFAAVDAGGLCGTGSTCRGGLHNENDGAAYTVERNSGVAERLVQNIRDGVYVPVELRCPALLPRFAQLIDCGLAVTAGQGSAKAAEHTAVRAAGHKSASFEKTADSGNTDTAANRRTAPQLPLTEQLCSYCDESLPLFAGGRQTGVQAQQTDALKGGGQAPAAEAQAALKAFVQTARKRITRKRFFVRNRAKIAAAAAVCVALIAVTAAIVQYVRKPPETAGMSAEAVVYGFYTAVGTLDQTVTGAYTKNKAAALYDGLMVHLYVTGKTREAYERKKIYYTPQEFLSFCESVRSADTVYAGDASVEENGSDAKDEFARYKKAVIESLNGGSVYGISGLEIVSSAQAGWFDVKFYHWLPIFSSEEAEAAAKAMEKALEAPVSASNVELSERGAFPVQVLYKHDRVQVITERDCFFIGAIESVESTVVADSSDALIEACALPPADRPAYLKGL